MVCDSKCWSICKSCKNLRGQHPPRSKYSLPKNVRLGGSVWAPITLLFVDQSSPNFCYPTWNGLQLIKYFSDLRYFEPFRRYSRSMLTVVKNLAEFWTFFSPSQILGGRPYKIYTDFITPDWRHIIWKKFCEDTPTSPEVIVAHTLNFEVNFKFSGLKIFWGTPSQFGCALAGLGQSVARVKISGRSTP